MATVRAVNNLNWLSRLDPSLGLSQIRAVAERTFVPITMNDKSLIGQGITSNGIDLMVTNVIDDTVYVTVSISPFAVTSYFNSLDRIAPV